MGPYLVRVYLILGNSFGIHYLKIISVVLIHTNRIKENGAYKFIVNMDTIRAWKLDILIDNS